MGSPAAVARSLTRQVGRCSSNRDKMRKPLARASTRYSGRSGGSVAVVAVVAVVAEAGRSAADEELAVRRGIDGLPPLMVGSALSLRGRCTFPGPGQPDSRSATVFRKRLS